MPKEVILSQYAPPAVGPYSQGVKIGPLIFVSGQIPLDPASGLKVTGGVGRETEQVLDNIKAILTAAGADMSQVVRVTIYLKRIEDFKFMNDAYQRYFTDDPPARTTVQAAPPREALVCMDAIAVIG
jgi:2-iminobutanoate/2-iminopropanoate deaminase